MKITCVELFALAAAVHSAAARGSADRSSSAERLRNPDSSTLQSGAIASMIPSYDRFFKTLAEGPLNFLNMVSEEKAANDLLLEEEKEEYDALMEVFESLAANMAMSMSMQTNGPTSSPSQGRAVIPSDPVNDPETSPATVSPSAPTPVEATTAPQVLASKAPTPLPTVTEILPPVATGFPTAAPIPLPTATVPDPVTPAPSVRQTIAPTLANCPGITAAERIEQIVSILEAATGDSNLLDESTDQGKATKWILSEDEYQICPDDNKLVQRWAMAVVYFATGGDDWFQCSANPAAIDNCGVDSPFVGERRFLSPTRVCEWAGISCIDECVTEIEFEENNLVGTIPTEIGLLTDLLIWGMERGRLESTIPTEVAQLTNLIFLDLDYNQLTGTLTTELFSLQTLTQLDLNNNKLSGNIEGIGSLPNIEFIQLHDNLFTGTVPVSAGTLSQMAVFTLHESFITGDMPQEVCDLLADAAQGGSLTTLISDCTPPNQGINCDCCTDCRVPLQ